MRGETNAVASRDRMGGVERVLIDRARERKVERDRERQRERERERKLV